MDAIQAAQSNGHGKPAQTTSASPALGNGNGKKPTAKALTSVRGSTLPYAIAYARRGIGVFPVHDIEGDWQCSCGKLECSSAGKHPRFSGWQESATTDEGQIREWWQQYPTANVGAKCGADSNLTVLDVDGDEGRETLHALELEHGELPETPVAITGPGGAHYYFAFEDGVRNLVRFAPGLDIRAEGGFVVGVGSKTNRSYEWEAAFALGNELLPARMPTWLADLIKGANTSVNGNGRLTLPGKIPVGERNNWLYRLTRSLKSPRYGRQRDHACGAIGELNTLRATNAG